MLPDIQECLSTSRTKPFMGIKLLQDWVLVSDKLLPERLEDVEVGEAPEGGDTGDHCVKGNSREGSWVFLIHV